MKQKQKISKKTEGKILKRDKPIPQSKLKIVEEIEELMETKKTILIASIKNIPNSQFQEITKKLRGKAIVKVPKKNLVLRVLEKKSKEEIIKLKNSINDSFAILFSDLDSFELAGELTKNQAPAKAKAGQEAPKDIEIPAGPTDLLPGPAISELGALGIQIQIEGGKITIKQPKIIVKAGNKISESASSLLNKLNIKPFKVGFTPLCAFDTREKAFYSEIKIDREGILESLKQNYGKALAFAVEIGYYSKDTITFLIGKAGMHEKALKKLQNQSPKNKIEGENK